MKHKIIATDIEAFNTLFDDLIRRLELVSEKIVKAKFSVKHDLVPKYLATVWTKHESKEAVKKEIEAKQKEGNKQAADAMEREKKYEYAEKFKEGIVSCLHREKPMDRRDMYRGSVNVRREVGEWEVV